jgi:integrase
MPPRRQPKSEHDKFLDREVVRRLLDAPRAAGRLRDYFLLSLMYYLALRSTEVTHLRPEYFNWRTKEVRIPSAKRKPKPGADVRPEAGGARPMIVVPILFGEAVMRAACAWAEKSGQAWMFPSRTHPSKPVSTRQVRYTFRMWAKATEVPDEVSSHSLRHSAGTHVYEIGGAAVRKAGGDPVVLVRDFMRHSDISITSIYLHSTRGTIEAARNAMGGL